MRCALPYPVLHNTQTSPVRDASTLGNTSSPQLHTLNRGVPPVWRGNECTQYLFSACVEPLHPLSKSYTSRLGKIGVLRVPALVLQLHLLIRVMQIQ